MIFEHNRKRLQVRSEIDQVVPHKYLLCDVRPLLDQTLIEAGRADSYQYISPRSRDSRGWLRVRVRQSLFVVVARIDKQRKKQRPRRIGSIARVYGSLYIKRHFSHTKKTHQNYAFVCSDNVFFCFIRKLYFSIREYVVHVIGF